MGGENSNKGGSKKMKKRFLVIELWDWRAYDPSRCRNGGSYAFCKMLVWDRWDPTPRWRKLHISSSEFDYCPIRGTFDSCPGCWAFDNGECGLAPEELTPQEAAQEVREWLKKAVDQNYSLEIYYTPEFAYFLQRFFREGQQPSLFFIYLP